MATGGAAQRFLELIFDAVNSARDVGLFQKDNDSSRHFVTSFSDLIAFGWPIRDDAEAEIGHTVIETAYYQLDLATKGLMARGGLTVGMVFMDDGFAFGSALVEAYEIESTQAKYPRIVLSPEVMRLVREHGMYYGGIVRSPYETALLVDREGTAFINYLSVINDEDMDAKAAFLTHKQVIEVGLEEHQSDVSDLDKYLWLADYHNYWCRRTWRSATNLIVSRASGIHDFSPPSRWPDLAGSDTNAP
jgi:hypothetical protein